ncbi:hypothetical protein [Pelagibacterium montanilacus]|uniref:hypothetical protein n=1 Tax=Pelagibacterium montanilacus TaxID=2185280 RepID=UPI000F8C769A|nr:hypothetical protein [Pelagibacterium montanilacus]
MSADFSIQLNGRIAGIEAISTEEARALYKRGVRFSIFSPESGEFVLSRPYKLAHNLDRGTLTVIQ